MTEQEAIKRCDMLVNGFSVNHATYEAFTEDGKGYPTFNTMKEFAETCKYALDEIQQYRAIGTVLGYERAIQSSIENYNLYREYKSKVEQFEAIGTVEEIKSFFNENRKAGYKHGYADGYAKAIDEFVERARTVGRPIGCDHRENKPLYAHTDGTWHDLIADIAEQMKGGATW